MKGLHTGDVLNTDCVLEETNWIIPIDRKVQMMLLNSEPDFHVCGKVSLMVRMGLLK
jgi:hypothetical protein